MKPHQREGGGTPMLKVCVVYSFHFLFLAFWAFGGVFLVVFDPKGRCVLVLVVFGMEHGENEYYGHFGQAIIVHKSTTPSSRVTMILGDPKTKTPLTFASWVGNTSK